MSAPSPPDLLHSLTELPRSALETAAFALRIRSLIAGAQRGDGHPVLTLPGYGGGDGSVLGLRYFLRAAGYHTPRLGLGVNLDWSPSHGAERETPRIRSVDDAIRFREAMVLRVAERVRSVGAETGEKLSLVGWSMGGLYAFDIAQRMPEHVRCVITLGAPFGDPRGTSLFALLRKLSGSRVALEEQDFDGWIARSRASCSDVPVYVLYSPRDGIVPPDVARPAPHPALTLVEVDSSHVGFGLNPAALRTIAELLARR